MYFFYIEAMAWAYQPNRTDKTILLRNLTWRKLPFHMLLHSKDLKIQNYRHRFRSSQFLFPYLNKGIRCNHGVCFFLHVVECWVVFKLWLLIYKANLQSIWMLPENLTVVQCRASQLTECSALSNSQCGSATGELGQKHLPVVLPTRPRGSSQTASQNKMDSA